MLGLLFTYLMTYGGSVVALVNPYAGFLIYVSFAILKPGAGCWTWSVPAGNYSKFLAVSLLAGWALRGAGDWRFGRARVIVAALLGYLAWAACSALQARIPEVAWASVDGQAKIVLLVVVGMTMIDSVAKLKQLAWVILVSHGYVAYEMNMEYFSGYNRLYEDSFAGLDNNSVAITFVTCVGLGMFLCLGAARLWQKAVAAACVAFLVHAIMFSFSRGGMLGLIVVLGVSFLLIPKKPVHYLALVAGVVLTLAATGPEVAARFGSTFKGGGERDGSAQSRLDMWAICVRVAGDQPVLGLGPNHFHVHAHEFGLPVGKEAHTTWLQLATEVGVPGVLFLLIFFLGTVFELWTFTRTSVPVPDPFFRDVARMTIAGITGFMFTAQFVTIPGVEGPYYVVLLGAGAVKLLSHPEVFAAPNPVGLTAEAGVP